MNDHERSLQDPRLTNCLVFLQVVHPKKNQSLQLPLSALSHFGIRTTADIYSLGQLMYFILTSRRPYTGAVHRRERPTTPRLVAFWLVLCTQFKLKATYSCGGAEKGCDLLFSHVDLWDAYPQNLRIWPSKSIENHVKDMD